MKRKFYFHRVDEPLAADTTIYRLWVGESVREQRMLTQIVAWAFAHHATLMSWREDIDYYLMIESERVFPGSGLLDFGFIQRDITASECLRHIEADDWALFESSPEIPHSLISQIMKNSPAKLVRPAGRVIPSKVLTEKRKNLSQRGDGCRQLIRFV